MRYKLVFDEDACKKRFQPIYKKAQKFLDSEVLRTSAPYVPMQTGNLMRSGNVGTKLGEGEVIYNAPYASRMYYGTSFNFSKKKHPQACAQWFEVAKAANKDAWIKGVNEIIKKG